MEKTIPTKDRILDAALTLFAEKGYDGVGVDLIAANAGIKGPSLYKHFKGKEEILNALIDRADAYYDAHFGSVQNPGRIPSSVEEFYELATGRMRFTLNDPTIRKVRRLLAMEQFRNPSIARLASLHSMEGVQKIFERIFAAMMEQGTLRKGDPCLVAIAFCSPVSLYIQCADREPERLTEMTHAMETYMKDFLSMYNG